MNPLFNSQAEIDQAIANGWYGTYDDGSAAGANITPGGQAWDLRDQSRGAPRLATPWSPYSLNQLKSGQIGNLDEWNYERWGTGLFQGDGSGPGAELTPFAGFQDIFKRAFNSLPPSEQQRYLEQANSTGTRGNKLIDSVMAGYDEGSNNFGGNYWAGTSGYSSDPNATTFDDQFRFINNTTQGPKSGGGLLGGLFKDLGPILAVAGAGAGLGSLYAGLGAGAGAGGTAYGIGSGAGGLGFNASGAFGGASTLGGIGGSGLGFAGTAANAAGWGGFGAGLGGLGYGGNMDWLNGFSDADTSFFDNFEFPSNFDVRPTGGGGDFGSFLDGFDPEYANISGGVDGPINSFGGSSTNWGDILSFTQETGNLQPLWDKFKSGYSDVNKAYSAFQKLTSTLGLGGSGGGLAGLLSGNGGLGQTLSSLTSGVLTNAQKKAIEGARDTSVGLADPFASQRPQYQQQLSTLMSNPGSMSTSPAFQGIFDLGMEAVNRTASAKGQLNSGNRLSALSDFGQKTASQYYFPQAQLLSNLAGVNAGSPATAAGINLAGTETAQNLRSKQGADFITGLTGYTGNQQGDLTSQLMQLLGNRGI